MNLPLWLLVFLVDFYLGAQVYPADPKTKKSSNRLIYEKSPYLFQHARKAGSIRQKMPTVKEKKAFFLWPPHEVKNCLGEEWGERLASLSHPLWRPWAP